MKIGEVMLKMGVLTSGQLEAIIIEQEEERKNSTTVEPLGNYLIRKGLITEEKLDEVLVVYFKGLTTDSDQPSYVRETAKVAVKAIEKRSTSNRLSEESKLTILRKIHEYEEKIIYYEKSIKNLKNLEQKKVIVETIDKENKEIGHLMAKIDVLKKDLESLS